MDFSKFNKFSIKQISLSLILFFALIVLIGAFGILGGVGAAIAKANFWLFGYIGYIWLFGVAYIVYKIKKPLKLDQIPLEKALGYVLAGFAFLILQALFFKGAGILGVAFNSVLEPLIKPLGIFILVLVMAVMASVLISGKSLKELLKILSKDLKKEVKDFSKENQKIKKNNKEILSKIKDFFTPQKPQKEEKKVEAKEAKKEEEIKPQEQKEEVEIPREMTLEELLKNNPNLQKEAKAMQDAQAKLLNEEEYKTQELKDEVISHNDSFCDEIDEMRQGVELQTWQKLEESNEKNLNKQNNNIEIKRISGDEAPISGYDLEQFQMQSMETLKRLQDFDANVYFKRDDFKKEEEDNTIRLIKSDEMPQTQMLEEFKEVEQESFEEEKEEVYQKPKKLIKEYPKKLYTAVPFSSYLGQESEIQTQEDKNLKENEENNKSDVDFIKDAIKQDLKIAEDSLRQQDVPEDLEEIESVQEESIEDIGDIVQQDVLEIQEELKADLENAENSLKEAQEVQEIKETQETKEIQPNPQEIKERAQRQEIFEQIAAQQAQTNFVQPSYLYYGAMNFEKEEKPIQQAVPQEIKEEKQEVLQKEIQQEMPQEVEAQAPQEVETIEIFSDKKDKEKVADESLNEAQMVETYKKELISGFEKLAEIEEEAIQRSEFANTIPEDLIEVKPQNVMPQEIPQEVMQTTQELPQITQELPQSTQEVPQHIEIQTHEPQETQEQENAEENTNSIHVKVLSENQDLLSDIESDENHKIDTKDFVLPPLDFLQEPKSVRVEIDEAEIDKKVADLLSKLRMFKIEGDVVRTYSGPLVTTIEFRPSPNVKVTKITACEPDLAMALRAKTIRIQAPIPGKDVVGIEIPNDQIDTIYLREILESDLFKNSVSPLTLALGKDITGNPFITDLKKLPHVLIAGTTGSGKSVGINAMIISMLYKNTPETLRLIMIDPKMLEFSMYDDIPHLLTPVITEPKKAIIALDNAVKEMERRYLLMSGAKTKNIESYNQKAEIDGFEKFPYIVIVIDEFADLMMSGGKEAEVSIARLAQKSRACGIHLIVATQRPSVDVVTSIIKANLPSRISYKVGSKIDSKVVLDEFGAETLLGRGDMLFTPPGAGIVRLHAPWVDENEIEKIVEFLKDQCPVQYDENFMPSEDEAVGLNYDGEVDELYEEAKKIMLNDNKTSISYIQRRLGIGYNKAANIVEQMEARGFLSAPNSKGVREIINE